MDNAGVWADYHPAHKEKTKWLVRRSPDAAHPLRTPPRTPLRTALSAPPSPRPLRTLSAPSPQVRLLQLDTLQPTGEEEMVEMVEHADEEAYEPFDESRHGSPTA